MRVIDHRRFHRRRSNRLKVILPIILVIALSGGVISWVLYKKPIAKPNASGTVLAQHQNSSVQSSTPQKEEYKVFAGDEFKQLYERIAYPNTQLLRQPPEITGNATADARIRTIAESRGYLLRSVPVAPILKSNEPGLGSDDLLQYKALNAWHDLKQAADKDGIPLKLNSGYRSINDQRQLFVSRLRATGATNEQIASGAADNKVVQTLTVTAIPGYSRHHTGYTIDVLCGTAVQAFETTRCYKWLSGNNYLNAKKHGWVPSYPEGVNLQGPEPESWEYVWVGKRAVLKD
jgi:LAS superfamily LD-carboxypeptidase LdcB